MFSFLKNGLKDISIPKLIGLAFLGIVIIAVAIWLIGFAFRSAFYGGNRYAPAYDDYDTYYGESYEDGVALNSKVSPPGVPGREPGTVGTDAESFEVTDYTATIQTSNLDRTCGVIEDLKQFDYVIFEQREAFDRGCSYVFKVTNERADDVLAVVENLDPEELRARTETIKRSVDDVSNEITILEKKLASIEETLTDAQLAYDEVTELATRTQDVESLATIIDSKINLIERLTQERITIKERIDRLDRAQLEQLDRLNFTFFHIMVREFLIVDGEAMKDSWLYEAQRFVGELNKVIQGVTINLATYALRLIQGAIYILLALLVVKYGWRLVKKLWTF